MYLCICTFGFLYKLSSCFPHGPYLVHSGTADLLTGPFFKGRDLHSFIIYIYIYIHLLAFPKPVDLHTAFFL
ncbi:hypothetical protein J3Q64DRAFT_1774092, partial [Phycomyces blakesleeanus]